jgi:type IV pilus assembly protein PilB
MPAELNQRQIHDFRKKMINYKNIHQGQGCELCHYTGYRGRIGIYDLLLIDDNIKQNILNNKVALSQLRKTGEKRGKSNLQKQCLKKVVSGETSLEELSRVLGHST